MLGQWWGGCSSQSRRLGAANDDSPAFKVGAVVEKATKIRGFFVMLTPSKHNLNNNHGNCCIFVGGLSEILRHCNPYGNRNRKLDKLHRPLAAYQTSDIYHHRLLIQFLATRQVVLERHEL